MFKVCNEEQGLHDLFFWQIRSAWVAQLILNTEILLLPSPWLIITKAYLKSDMYPLIRRKSNVFYPYAQNRCYLKINCSLLNLLPWKFSSLKLSMLLFLFGESTFASFPNLLQQSLKFNHLLWCVCVYVWSQLSPLYPAYTFTRLTYTCVNCAQETLNQALRLCSVILAVFSEGMFSSFKKEKKYNQQIAHCTRS